MKLTKQIKKIIAATTTFFDKTRLAGLIYNTFRKRCDINGNVILLDSHHGKDFIGNPYYLAKHLVGDSTYNDFKIVVTGKLKSKRALQRFDYKKRIRTCNVHSFSFCYYLAISKFLISDVTFPPYFSRRKGQNYLNTWHGTPLKSLGRHVRNQPFKAVSNCQRNFLHATHLLAPNHHTERVLLHDYMINDIWQGKIIRQGYPRNDIFHYGNIQSRNTSFNKENFNIIFMPTWRGSTDNVSVSAKHQLKNLSSLFTYLDKNLPENIYIWVRLHPILNDKLDLFNFKRFHELPNNQDPYELLVQCDALITDYSSVMFDFSNSNKPILLYAPDITDYLTERNFCLDFSEIPFPVAYTSKELVHLIKHCAINNFTPPESYKFFQQRFCPFDNGQSSQTICEHFILGRYPELSHHHSNKNNKKNVLIFVGSFLNNGITTSLKNLISLIDKNRYNIYLLIDQNIGEARARDYFQMMDTRIKYIASSNYLSVDFIDGFRFVWQDIKHETFFYFNEAFQRIWKNEYRRLFCDSSWDSIIHFPGYERRISFLMLFSNAKKIIFMHNDMYLEGTTKRNYDERALKLAYKHADIIATVRRNVENKYCDNVLNIKQKTRYIPNTLSTECKIKAKMDIRESFSLEMDTRDIERIIAGTHIPQQFRFINLGRFSPEKGQKRLIEAFESVWANAPSTQLYIAGGYGVQYDEILEISNRSIARDSIFVIMGTDNPFPIFSKMDATIFSSYHEGLPMTIFESLAFGIPVVSTDIPGPSEFLNQGYGIVVENSVDGLIEGMTNVMNGYTPKLEYGFDTHNIEALCNFYSLID